MDVFAAAERLMRMKDADWERHANPWSVWTRMSCLPLLALAIWSRVWIGWYCVPVIAAALMWTYHNPRAFSAPRDWDSWAARATLGERMFLNRHTGAPIATHHVRALYVLTLLSAVGLIPLIYGLSVLNPWAALTGLVATILPKLWFCDRMVWIHAEMRNRTASNPMPDPILSPERTT